MVFEPFYHNNFGMKGIRILFLFLVLTASACTKERLPVNYDNLLLGTWYFSEYVIDISVYKRTASIPDDKPGFIFSEDGTLNQRKNVGWCGTPPVSYGNYDGTWKMLSDTLMQVKVGYWEGIESFNIDLESVNEELLRLRITY